MPSEVEWAAAFFPFVAALLLAFLGWVVVHAGRRTAGNVAFAVLAFVMALLGFLDTVLNLMAQSNPAWPRLYRVWGWVGLGLPLLFVHLSLVFPYRTRHVDPLVSLLGVALAWSGLVLLWNAGTVSDCLRSMGTPQGPVCVKTPLGMAGLLYASAAAFVGFVVLIAKLRGARTLIEAARARLVATAFGLLVFSTLPPLLIPWLGVLFGLIVQGVLWVLTIVFAVMVAYAILKYQVFDVDHVFRQGVSYTFTFLVIALLWVTIGEILEDVVGAFLFDATGLEIGDLVASVLSAIVVFFLIAPIQERSVRLLEHLFPRLKAAHEEGQVPARAVEIYQAALEEAWADGAVRGRELQVLARLRDALGIPNERHAALERQVHRQLGIAVPAG